MPNLLVGKADCSRQVLSQYLKRRFFSDIPRCSADASVVVGTYPSRTTQTLNRAQESSGYAVIWAQPPTVRPLDYSGSSSPPCGRNHRQWWETVLRFAIGAEPFPRSTRVFLCYSPTPLVLLPQAADEPHAAELPHAADEPHAAVEPHAAELPHAADEPQAAVEPHAAELPHAADEPQAAVDPHAAELPQAAVEPQAAESGSITCGPQTFVRLQTLLFQSD
jgi:hypothetical protein